MSDMVPSEMIERIVGMLRHDTAHIARASSRERRVYILHPHTCIDSGIDLRDCEFSIAMDRGIDEDGWMGKTDRPVKLAIADGRLVADE